MIVCSCNRVSDRHIYEAVDGLMLRDPIRILTPTKVYRTIGVRPSCGSCLPHAAELIHKHAACLRGCHGCDCPNAAGATLATDNTRTANK